MLIDLDDAFLLATANDAKRYIKIDAKTTGSYKTGDTIVYPEPLEHPIPNRMSVVSEEYAETKQYPFVVYGGPDLYTEIGWNGDLKLKGSHGSGNVGSISLDASGEIPFEIKSNTSDYTTRYIQMNWDASMVLSGENGLTGQQILLDASAPVLAPLPN